MRVSAGARDPDRPQENSCGNEEQIEVDPGKVRKKEWLVIRVWQQKLRAIWQAQSLRTTIHQPRKH
jgi:hypothetical protein